MKYGLIIAAGLAMVLGFLIPLCLGDIDMLLGIICTLIGVTIACIGVLFKFWLAMEKRPDVYLTSAGEEQGRHVKKYTLRTFWDWFNYKYKDDEID